VFNILQYSEMECNCVKKITESFCLKSRVRYDNIRMKVQWQCQNIIHLGRKPPKCCCPRLQPVKPIGKSGSGHNPVLLSSFTIYRRMFNNTE